MWRHVFPAEPRDKNLRVREFRKAFDIVPLAIADEGMASGAEGQLVFLDEGVMGPPMLAAR